MSNSEQSLLLHSPHISRWKPAKPQRSEYMRILSTNVSSQKQRSKGTKTEMPLSIPLSMRYRENMIFILLSREMSSPSRIGHLINKTKCLFILQDIRHKWGSSMIPYYIAGTFLYFETYCIETSLLPLYHSWHLPQN